jgi:hypothetical protein
MATPAAAVWDRWELLASPLFATLAPLIERLPEDHFPTLAELNRLCAEREVVSGGGEPLEFVPQEAKTGEPYEKRVYAYGKVLTRNRNWHDLFNALVWLAFPRTKTALNARHFESIAQSAGEGNRDKNQDALTLFDESGVVVLYADDEMANLLQGFHWHELFWEERESVNERMKFVVFGHSLYEKALKPYIGFTGKGLLIKVDKAFFALETDAQLNVIDGLMADCLSTNGQISSRDLSPVPLLGVPGWWKDNEDVIFYANARYFRVDNSREKRS